MLETVGMIALVGLLAWAGMASERTQNEKMRAMHKSYDKKRAVDY